MVIADVDMALTQAEKIKFPIILNEALTAVVAVPLWLDEQMYGIIVRSTKSSTSSTDIRTT